MLRSRRIARAVALVVVFAACSDGADDGADATTADSEVAATTDGRAPDSSGSPPASSATDTVADTGTVTGSSTAPSGEATTASSTRPTTTNSTDPFATTVAVPPVPLTPPATQLTFGQPAIVNLDDAAPHAVVQLTVQPVRVGTAEELASLNVDGIAGNETLFYVDLDITNLSAPESGAEYAPSTNVQLTLMTADQQLARPVVGFTDFAPCENEVPDTLSIDETYSTCITFLGQPEQTAVEASFAPNLSTAPILWH